MAVRVTWADAHDPARVVDALLTAATVEDHARPLLATRYRRLADELGTALDHSPSVRVPAHGADDPLCHPRATPGP